MTNNEKRIVFPIVGLFGSLYLAFALFASHSRRFQVTEYNKLADATNALKEIVEAEDEHYQKPERIFHWRVTPIIPT
jgi:hypothetical protein